MLTKMNESGLRAKITFVDCAADFFRRVSDVPAAAKFTFVINQPFAQSLFFHKTSIFGVRFRDVTHLSFARIGANPTLARHKNNVL